MVGGELLPVPEEEAVVAVEKADKSEFQSIQAPSIATIFIERVKAMLHDILVVVNDDRYHGSP